MKPIWVPAVAALLATAPLTGLAAGPAASSAEAKAPFCAVQPVQEYFTPVAGDGRDFSSLYTHIGTDFGRMGPGDHRIAWESGAVRVDLAHHRLQFPLPRLERRVAFARAGVGVEEDVHVPAAGAVELPGRVSSGRVELDVVAVQVI